MLETREGQWLAWVQCLAEGGVCDTKEDALMSLAEVLVEKLEGLRS